MSSIQCSKHAWPRFLDNLEKWGETALMLYYRMEFNKQGIIYHAETQNTEAFAQSYGSQYNIILKDCWFMGGLMNLGSMHKYKIRKLVNSTWPTRCPSHTPSSSRPSSSTMAGTTPKNGKVCKVDNKHFSNKNSLFSIVEETKTSKTGGLWIVQLNLIC